MLELKLFEDLEEPQQREAAGVVASIEKRQPGESRRISPDQIAKEVIDDKLKHLFYSIEPYVVITGIDEGKVVVVYEMPPFVRAGKERDFLRNNEPGYITTYPPGKGYSSMVVESLAQILERVAYAASSKGLFHDVSTAPTTLFTRFGYKDIGDSDNTGRHTYNRRYKPRNHSLGPNQERIVNDFLQRISAQDKYTSVSR